jgi:hypothetical protein
MEKLRNVSRNMNYIKLILIFKGTFKYANGKFVVFFYEIFENLKM